MTYRSRASARTLRMKSRRSRFDITDFTQILKRIYPSGPQPKWAAAAFRRNWLTPAQFDEICETTTVADGFAMIGGLEELFYSSMPMLGLIPRASP